VQPKACFHFRTELTAMPSRRDFLHTTIATLGSGAALALGARSLRAQTDSPTSGGASSGSGKRILILGGTGFLGPAIVEVAKQRGHSLTLFNRGRTEKRIGIIEDVEKRYGNRDPKPPADETKNEAGEYINPSPKGLESLQEGEWDSVIDTSGYYPRIVKASAELLAPRIKQYIFISSVSAYADNSKPYIDETAPVATIADPTVETMGAQFENYGALKALCEQAAEAAMPGKTANIRPGLIVGPGDPTDRFTYWPVRIQKGGEVLAPGDPSDPVQLIDVRDLAEWIVLMVENNTVGLFNAINPAPGRLGIGQTLEACKNAAKSDAKLTWVPAEFLEKHEVSAWGDMPLWLPPTGETSGSHLRSNERAVNTGLKFRPVEDTAAAILAWWPKEIARRERVGKQMIEDAQKAGKPAPQLPDPTKLRYGCPPEKEAAVLKAWHESKGVY
jgi:2'-hydroxyisoflavone reductase